MKQLLAPAIATAAMLILAAPAAAQTPCAGSDSPVTADTQRAREALICMINNERTTRGFPALARNAALDQATQAHADDMVARNYKNAQAPAPAPNGTTPGERALNAGYPSGGNLSGFFGWNVTGTPREVMTFQMRRGQDSCPAVLSPIATEIGVGIAAASDGARYIVSIGGPGAPPVNPACPVNGLATPTAGAAPTVAQQTQAAQALASKPASQVAGALGFPSPKVCQSKRAFKIRIKETSTIKIKSATLDLVGRKIKTKREGGRLVGLVDLRGFAKGTFVLKINATTTTGVKLKGTRKYKTCVAKKTASL